MSSRPQRRERRKSLSLFGTSSTTSSTPPDQNSHDRSTSEDYRVLRRRPRRNSGFFGSNSNNSSNKSRSTETSQVRRRPGTANSEIPTTATASAADTAPPLPPQDVARLRQKSMRKRRTSMFGSLRSQYSIDDFDSATRRSKNSSVDGDDNSLWRNGSESMVIHHGEVQTTGGMWRKKSQYLVLTDTHLVRFKSQNKAADMFPSLSASSARAVSGSSRQSISSINSLQDPILMAHSDGVSAIALRNIIAAYALDDGRLSSTVEIAYLDERTHKASLIQMHTPDIQDLDLWMSGIRSAARLARATNPLSIDQASIDLAVDVLEHEKDYDPLNFRLFRVLQMASTKFASGSSEDLTKVSPTGCFLAIGSHKIHLIPFQKASNRASGASSNDLETATSFGLMALTGLSMEWGEDSLHLTFRVPFCKPFSVFLASVHSIEIALWVRQHTEFLRPLWAKQPYHFVVPRELEKKYNLLPLDPDEEDYGCFDRTLIAYSASYNVDTSNIRYTIDMECEDAPCFKLLPPASPGYQTYSALELVAVMRTLRYNDSFRSVSFAGISLDPLRGVRDFYGPDKDAFITRAGARVSIPGQEHLSVLSQEIRALALKSKWLRRMDFSYCIAQPPTFNGGDSSAGCDIPEAVFPVIRRELLTSIDWVGLNGIKLGESDLDYLVDAASQKGSHLRALEVGNCGLSVHDFDLLVSTVVAQEATLEAINVSGVQGRLSPDTLQQFLGYFGQLRKLDLSRLSRTSGPDPLISLDMLLNWHLEELSLSRTAVNQETTRAIADYLASDKSRSLRVLRMDQCGLTGEDVATLLRYMVDVDTGIPRNLHLYVNENKLDTACSCLSDAIAHNLTPSHMSMRMIDFQKEEHFRELVEAVRKNKTLKFLDISKASLPYDAGPETCKSLQLMLEENDALEDLDISGESAHLDMARFGIGINLALTGLKKNTSLRVLRIEHQRLGFQGASTLASVLEANACLREVHCENNEINLQSFTVLINSLQRNKSLLSLSCMDRDRVQSLERIRRELENVTRESSSSHTQNPPVSAFRRSLFAAVGHVGGSKLSKPSSVMHMPRRNNNGLSSSSASVTSASSDHSHALVNHEVEDVLYSLENRWDVEVARLYKFLYRNYNLAHGVVIDDSGDDDGGDGDDDPLQQGVGIACTDGVSVDVDLPPQTAEANSEKTLPEYTRPEVTISTAEKDPVNTTIIPASEGTPLSVNCGDVEEKKTQHLSAASATTAIDFDVHDDYDDHKNHGFRIFDSLNSSEYQNIELDDPWSRPKSPYSSRQPSPLAITTTANITNSNTTTDYFPYSSQPPPPYPSFVAVNNNNNNNNNNHNNRPRNTRSLSSSTIATTGSSARNLYTSTLKGIVNKGTSRENKRMEKTSGSKPKPTYGYYNHNNNNSNSSSGKFQGEKKPTVDSIKKSPSKPSPSSPPQLNWSPPKLDLESLGR